MLNLDADWRNAWVTNHGQLLRRGPHLDSAAPAIETHARPAVFRNVVIVDVVNDRDIHIRHRAIVGQVAVIPISSIVSVANVSKTVIDAAIETNMGSPVAGVPMVEASIKTPPRRCPKRSYKWRHDPSTGDPIIARARITPVTRRPHIVLARRGRLSVLRKRRRRLGRL